MNAPIILIKPTDTSKVKILWLGNTPDHPAFMNELSKAGCEVWTTEESIDATTGFDLVISYGYRHILKKHVIEGTVAPIINLHISYLPWNRGAHPNFWSFYDCTPSGVTIHLIDEGVDTGAIIYQRYVNFTNEENTFYKTYERLLHEVEQLFLDNLDEILLGNFIATPQRRKGSYHCVADLPSEFEGWDADIKKEIARLDKILIKDC
jgi:methionyl-tRNA formyltransferase